MSYAPIEARERHLLDRSSEGRFLKIARVELEVSLDSIDDIDNNIRVVDGE